MPELPEVETIARQLREHGVEGRRIESVQVHWPRTVAPLSVKAFAAGVKGATVDRISRVGKWMVVSLGSGWSLLIHLRMSGGFSFTPSAHDRLVLGLSDGVNLHYRDPRKFGRWRLLEDPQRILGALGPDALSRAFTLRGLHGALHARRRQIKPLLLDQSIVAGLGNIYVDEALWEARIHPERISGSLKDAEICRLYRAIKQVLRVAVSNRGTSLGVGMSNYRDLEGNSGGEREKAKVYGQAGTPCKRCRTTLQRLVVAQRGTTFCPSCQRLGPRTSG